MILFLWMKKWKVQSVPVPIRARRGGRDLLRIYLIVLLAASAVYIGCMVSPPSLMDDVDAVQAQIARNMLASGDWVTARLDGIPYLEKPPLLYWLIAIAYRDSRRGRLGGQDSGRALRPLLWPSSQRLSASGHLAARLVCMRVCASRPA